MRISALQMMSGKWEIVIVGCFSRLEHVPESSHSTTPLDHRSNFHNLHVGLQFEIDPLLPFQLLYRLLVHGTKIGEVKKIKAAVIYLRRFDLTLLPTSFS
jgi:hypothetical protein